jgi:hypothetical protein
MNILATTALSVGAITLSASPSTDGRPQEAPIDIHVERSCPASDSCTFSASGAITDEGVVVTESIKAFALAAARGGDGGVCADGRSARQPDTCCGSVAGSSIRMQFGSRSSDRSGGEIVMDAADFGRILAGRSGPDDGQPWWLLAHHGPAIGLGMVIAGVGLARQPVLAGAGRWLLLAMGGYVFVVMFPAVFGPLVAGRIAIGVWMLMFAALGASLVRADPSVRVLTERA